MSIDNVDSIIEFVINSGTQSSILTSSLSPPIDLKNKINQQMSNQYLNLNNSNSTSETDSCD